MRRSSGRNDEPGAAEGRRRGATARSPPSTAPPYHHAQAIAQLLKDELGPRTPLAVIWNTPYAPAPESMPPVLTGTPLVAV